MPEPEHFHILSFEGLDAYARAGGIATRITGLSEALAEAGHETHLWFVGDPQRPGSEDRGLLRLHRWCQWISRYHPLGVYDGEEGKISDYAASLPPFLLQNHLFASRANGRRAFVIAEEWHTVDAVLHLDWLLRHANLRDAVTILWNANNTFGFDRIDWPRLDRAATITTVSRYMKQRMCTYGVDPVVIPNGLGPESFIAPDRGAVSEIRRRFADRLLLAKVARWDPDKRWLLAVDTVAELKRRGARPLLIARGGVESHEQDVLERARAHGLRVLDRPMREHSTRGLVRALDSINGTDVLLLRSHLDPQARGVLFRSADAVLANSGHEPFGLVGLEAMAVGGVACTGASGEDYAVHGENAIVLQTNEASEFVSLFARLRESPQHARALRRSGRQTARQYAWSRVLDRALLPRIRAGVDANENRVA